MATPFEDVFPTFEIADAARVAAAAELTQAVNEIIARKNLAEMEAALERLPDEYTKALWPATIFLRKGLPPLGERPELETVPAIGTRVVYSDTHFIAILQCKLRPSLQAGTVVKTEYRNSGHHRHPVVTVAWDDDLPEAWKAWKRIPIRPDDHLLVPHSLSLLNPPSARKTARGQRQAA